ncbi:MAG: GerMN domain-containing protein [Candidatus Aminicenantes bacterium]|jgi:germination protein M|nr:GerMN domain-containing protein [Candidatus Aminicenantes bacterium]
MEKRKNVLAAALFVLLAVLVVVFFRTSGREQIRRSKDVSSSSASVQNTAEKQMKTVSLFFLREEDGLLVPEEREIAADASLVREAKEVISELIKGSRGDLVSPLPPETKLGQLFITKDGTAYVDVSKDIVDYHPSGTAAEISTVYTIVNSLTYNFKPIKKVFILIEGEERETLGGHISLDRPFLPDYSLVAKR